MTASAPQWFRRLAALTGALLLATCVVVQQLADQTDDRLVPELRLVAGHHHAHHHHHGHHDRQHGHQHGHQHRHHRGHQHRHHHNHHHSHHRHQPSGRRMVRYTVRPGDTPTGLAVRFHAWTAELLAVNHLGPHETIYVGQTLVIPVVRAAARRARQHERHRHHAHHRHGGHHRTHHHGHHHGHHRGHHHGHHRGRHHFGRHHHHYARHHHPGRHGHRYGDPTRAAVRRAIIGTAHRYGVGHNLALAIAWQESGWQMDRISSAHAVGAMQVLPSTGRWLSTLVGHRLELRDLHDNVTAGVVLIRVLREQARVRYAVAGYYQGLGSVRQHGMYRDTRRYVADVLYLRRLLRHGWNPA